MIEVKNKWAIGGIFVAVGGAFVGLAVWLSPGQPVEQTPQQIEQAGQVEPETTTVTAVPAGTETANSGGSGAVSGGDGEPEAPADRPAPRPPDNSAEPADEPDPADPPVGGPPPNQVPTSTTEWHPYCLGPEDPTPGCIPQT